MIKTPYQITESAAEAGRLKGELATFNSRSLTRLFALSVMAGAYIAIGAVMSTVAGFGFPGACAGNPSLQKLLSGAVFPIGLMLVVVLGAELFTGNNAMLIPAFMTRKASARRVIANWAMVYAGNFAGAVAFAFVFVYLCGITGTEPYHQAAIDIATAKVSMPWYTVLFKGIGANWLVCLGVWLALSADTLVGKMVGCWWPVMAFVVLGYEHCVANMYFIPIGMMEGADVTVSDFFAGNLIWSTIGNIIGGALFVGALHGWLHLKKDK